MREEEQEKINQIRQGNEQIFNTLFDDYYVNLVNFAEKFIFDQHESEDLVQDFFAYFWQYANDIKIETSIKAYFFQAIRNRCLNYLKAIKTRNKHYIMYMDVIREINNDSDLKEYKIAKDMNKLIQELPEQMQYILKMRIINGLSRKIIADELNISINTVKTQLTRAKSKIQNQILI